MSTPDIGVFAYGFRTENDYWCLTITPITHNYTCVMRIIVKSSGRGAG